MSNYNGSLYSTNEISLSRTARFWLLLLSEVPSLICSIFIIFHLLIDRQERRSLNNHPIILMNITGLFLKCTDVPFYLDFIRNGKVSPSTPIHCLIWWVGAIAFYYITCLLAAWASMERHILVFHRARLNTAKGRFLFHYFPLIIICIYSIIFYTWVIFILPCENIYDYTLPVCGAIPCYINDPIFGVWELIFHGCICTIITTVFSIGLVIRVIIEKLSRHLPIEWRKHRKMTIQMLSISSIFIFFNLPITTMAIAHLAGLPYDVGAEIQLYFFFLSYWLIFLLPFVSLNSLTNLKQKIKRSFGILSQRQTTIGVLSTRR
ncbi:unnamed protein product [Adineta ricciae]|uniref:Uncharacterized protein n=1 Tax=Adineta ricciae TaxID=249248 RepID=A0A814ZZM0_ADIRI|nr:unnamed protein product [Adineta ricciae]